MCSVGYVSCGDDDAPLLGSKVPGQWVLLKDGETEGDTLISNGLLPYSNQGYMFLHKELNIGLGMPMTSFLLMK